MEIRPATVEDATGIMLVRTRGWQEGYAGLLPPKFLENMSITPTPRLKAALSHPEPDCHDFVAVNDEGETVAWAKVGPFRTSQDSPEVDRDMGGELYVICVRQPYWGSGTASKMMQVALQPLAEADLHPIRLWVFRDNYRARAFYEKLGFVFDGTEDVFSIPSYGIEVPEVRYTLDTSSAA